MSIQIESKGQKTSHEIKSAKWYDGDRRFVEVEYLDGEKGVFVANHVVNKEELGLK